jgi:hypothetical protein
MDEIVKQITERTGLPADQAHVAAQTVVDFLKAKLPAPIAGQIDTVLAGSAVGDAIGQASQALGGLGGMLGNKD